MNAFLDNARELFEVAGSDKGRIDCDFALFVRRDGGLHMVMDLGSAPGGIAPGLDLPVPSEVGDGLSSAYRVTRLRGAVRVQGRSGSHRCLLESHAAGQVEPTILRMVLRDERLYSVIAPLLEAPAGAIAPVWDAEERATTIPHTM